MRWTDPITSPLAVVSQQIVHPRPLCEGGCRQTTTCPREGSRMDVHKNARTTPHSRGLIAQRVHAGETVAAVARAFSVCDRTVRKWVQRAALAAPRPGFERLMHPGCLLDRRDVLPGLVVAGTVSTMQRVEDTKARLPNVAIGFRNSLEATPQLAA